MDDYLIFGKPVKECLNSLEEVLEKCDETQLVLNWKKCHFMVKEGIALGHKISNAGPKVDLSKFDVVSKLLRPCNVKPLRNFLGHTRFYKRFICGFSQTAKPLSNLLCAYQPFIFYDKCNQAFQAIKDALTSTSTSSCQIGVNHLNSCVMRVM